MYTVLCYGAAELLDDLSYTQQCSIGFSGILFALKVVANNEESAELQGNLHFHCHFCCSYLNPAFRPNL